MWAPQAKGAGDAALMPAESAVAGWKKVETSRVFTKADLYGYIDGGAEVFLEFGFDQLTLQKYANGPSVIAVEVYRMADPVASTGIYLMKCGKETRDPSFKERHTINRHQLMFVRNRYYVTINNLSGAEGMGAGARSSSAARGRGAARRPAAGGPRSSAAGPGSRHLPAGARAVQPAIDLHAR